MITLEASLRARVADALKLNHPSFTLTPSEEAEVWCVREGDFRGALSHSRSKCTPNTAQHPVAWVKRHLTPASATRERRATEEWGFRLNAPTLIAALDERTSLIEHCEGLTLSELGALQLEGAQSLGSQIASLHKLSINDDDPLSLSEALAIRARVTLRELKVQVADLPQSHQAAYLHARHLLTELASPRLEDLSEDAYALLAQRVPCHRDLTLNHVRFADPRIQRGAHGQVYFDQMHLRVFDWGQSRLDVWTSDWVKLCVEWCDHHKLWDYAWRSYWQSRSEHLSADERLLISGVAETMLNRALASQALNTLRWSQRHHQSKSGDERHDCETHTRAAEVWLRGLKELTVMMTRSNAKSQV